MPDDPFDRVRRIALAFPGVADTLTFGSPSLKVNGKYLAQMYRDGESLILSMSILERDLWIAAEPDVFFITDHFRDYPGVLVRIAGMDDETLRDLMERAWRRRATKKLIKAYEDARH